MNTYPILKSTPIQEIILGISYNGGLNNKVIDSFGRSELVRSAFPLSNPSFNTDIKVKDGQNNPETTTTFDGQVFKNAETQADSILQVRLGSISLHLVKKYKPLDQLIAELKLYWKELNNHVDDLSVARLSVRYLNFIPMEEGTVLEDYLNFKTEHPFKNENTRMFHSVKFDRRGCEVNLVCLTGTLGGEQNQGVILDYTIKKDVEETINDCFTEFTDFQEIKNSIFFDAISEKTLKIYQ